MWMKFDNIDAVWGCSVFIEKSEKRKSEERKEINCNVNECTMKKNWWNKGCFMDVVFERNRMWKEFEKGVKRR